MKPINASQARIFRVRLNVAKAEVQRMQDHVQRLRVVGVECRRLRGIAAALADARRALEDGEDACIGVELDDIAAGGPREPVTRLRFTPR